MGGADGVELVNASFAVGVSVAFELVDSTVYVTICGGQQIPMEKNDVLSSSVLVAEIWNLPYEEMQAPRELCPYEPSSAYGKIARGLMSKVHGVPSISESCFSKSGFLASHSSRTVKN